MKITHIAHASVLIEAGGVSILSDPWWKGPCFGAQWWVYPPAHLDAVAATRIDYIYVSHGHHDHFHPGTMRTLPKSAKVLVSASLDLAEPIRALGFEVIEVAPDAEIALGGDGDVTVRARIVPTYGGDSLMAVSDGRRVVLNINDALHSAPRDVQTRHVAALKKRYPVIDYALCGYGTASHFPNCYVIPGKDSPATAVHRQRYFNRQWAQLMHDLEPRYAFPFAADVVFLEDALFWANEPVHNGERPVAAFREEFPDSRVTPIDIAPGFVIEDDVVVREVLREPIDAARLREEMAEGIRRANTYGTATTDAVTEVGDLLRQRVARLQAPLASYPQDYRMLIHLHNADRHFALVKTAGRVSIDEVADPDRGSWDIVYRTRLAYVKWALTERYGDELLFVGSGGVFEYASRELAMQNLHRELLGLLRGQVLMRESVGRATELFKSARSRVGRALGRSRVDLYDLRAWTVFS